MKNETIKTYTKITEAEALQLLIDNDLNPVEGMAFKNGKAWICGDLIDVSLSRAGPDVFHSSASSWFYDICAKVTELDPCKAPEGCPELEPWMAYVGVGNDLGYIEGGDDAYWSLAFLSYSYEGGYGGTGTRHYFIDVRTAWSKKHFPEHCRIRNYKEPSPLNEVLTESVLEHINYNPHTIHLVRNAYELGQANPITDED